MLVFNYYCNLFSFIKNSESLENVEKLSYVLGSELRESQFDGLLALQLIG